MRFPREMERQMMHTIISTPDAHVTVEPEAYRADGFVVIYRDNLAKLLHRYLHDRLISPVTRGAYLERTCHNERCVNPYHHRITKRSGKPRTHCPNRHRYTPKTTHVDRHGVRHCLTCRAEKNARRRKGTLARGVCAKGHKITPENDYPWTDRQGRVHHRCAKCKRDYQKSRRANA
jgi:hypothetical protein